MLLKQSTSNDHFVVATLYDELGIIHDQSADAQIIPVASPAILHKVQVPPHLKDLLKAARASAFQLRFNLTFDFPDGARLPIINSAAVVPLEQYFSLQPIPTIVSCGFCLEEPFDFRTGKWLSTVSRLSAREGASDLKIELYYKCIALLRSRSILPQDSPIFQFATQAFHHSDGDLLHNVSHQRWLLRATLPTLYFRSCEAGAPAALLEMRSEIQHENIKRLQSAFRSAFAGLAKHAHKGALVEFVQVGARRRCPLVCDMDVVSDALKNARQSQGHPLIDSFEIARRKNCLSSGSELPFTITKQPNSFTVNKVYLVKIDERTNWRSALRHDVFLSTTEYTCTGHLSTPHLQRLLDASERLGPREFSRANAKGIQCDTHSYNFIFVAFPLFALMPALRYKRDNEPVSLCLQPQTISGGQWFQKQNANPVDKVTLEAKFQARDIAECIDALKECDHVWSSEFSQLAHQVAAFGLIDAADGA